MLVVALPLKAVMLSHSDTNTAREVAGTVARRGLCGDVFLVSAPKGARIADVKIETSVRQGTITVDAGLQELAAQARYTLRAEIRENGRRVREFTSPTFRGADLKEGRFPFREKWLPGKLWDLHTPGNMYYLQLSLLAAGGKVLDIQPPARFGFREPLGRAWSASRASGSTSSTPTTTAASRART
jgi:hypothetical protein